MEKVTITIFTDPMMGLSYECQPVFDRLCAHYGEKLEVRHVMAGLVRDVSDFMTPQERDLLARDEEEGIRVYCRRLAQIYKSEESIGGLPINMEGFHLFDADHRTSWPLNIAYKAAQLADPDKADLFLRNLRTATIVETRQTTKTEEILRVVRKTGIDEKAFLDKVEDGSAKEAFYKDLEYTKSLGIHSLPSCLIQHGERVLLIQSLIGYEDFVQIIGQISGW